MNNGDTAIMVTYSNITKRELFSAMALQGMLASETPGETYQSKWAAMRAIEMADALIAELAKDRK